MIAHNRRHSFCFSGASLICLISLVLNNYSFLCLPLTRCLPAVYVPPANCAVFVWLIPPRCHQIKVSRSINCLSTTIRILLSVQNKITMAGSIAMRVKWEDTKFSFWIVQFYPCTWCVRITFIIDSSVKHVQGYFYFHLSWPHESMPEISQLTQQ